MASDPERLERCGCNIVPDELSVARTQTFLRYEDNNHSRVQGWVVFGNCCSEWCIRFHSAMGDDRSLALQYGRMAWQVANRRP